MEKIRISIQCFLFNQILAPLGTRLHEKIFSLFSDKGCCNCCWRKPGAADTHTLEIVGKALVNHASAYWPQRSAVSFVLGRSEIDLLIAGTALVLGKQKCFFLNKTRRGMCFHKMSRQMFTDVRICSNAKKKRGVMFNCKNRSFPWKMEFC